ncbi:MAG TPA: YfhO family protein [Acidimicrobiales bacterium]|nr:YfhO family protein [Acidimicrobiales bacterium]
MSRETLRRARVPAAVFLACSFLLMPLAMVGQRTYAAVDLMEPKAPYRDAIARPPEVVSLVQTDQAESLAGPAAFFRSLRRGTLRLWDPNVAAGNPLGTLPLTGLYSPFSVGFLFLPAWYAIGLKTFLALVFSQAFTYLLLRRLGAGVGPAILAGVAYTFSGTNLVFIHRVDAVFLLPALFWAVHRLVRGEPLGGHVVVRGVAVLAGLVAWAWLEGFPSGWVYCVYATAAWAGWLCVRGAPGVVAALRRGVAPAAGLLWGVALSAFTLVPFVSELLDRGTLDVRGGAAGAHIPSVHLFGLFHLSATGPPLHGPWWTGLNPVESVSHIGMITSVAVAAGLVAAALGRVRLTKEAAAVWPFFCGLAVVAVVVNFLGTPLLSVLEHLPGVARNPIGRSRFLIGLAAAVLAALALDAWWEGRSDEERRRRVRASRLAAGVTLAVLAGAVVLNVADFARAASAANRLRDVARGFSMALVLAGAAAALAAAAGRRPTSRLRLGATLAMAALLFAQLGWPLRHFTPEAPVADFYGETAGHRALGQALDGRYRFAASEFQFYPNSGQALGLPDLRGLALHSREFKALVRAFNPQAFDRDPLKIDLKREEWNLASPLLDHLAVRYFALGTTERPFGQLVEGSDQGWDRWAPIDGLAPEATAGVAPGPLAGVYVPLRATGDCRGARVELSVLGADRTAASTSRTATDVDGGWTGFAVMGSSVGAGDRFSLAASSTSAGCRLDVGLAGSRVARQLIVEDPAGPVRLVGVEQAWLYERPTAWELVSAHGRWRAFPDQARLLAWAAARPPDDADVAAFVDDGGRYPEPGNGPAPVVESFRMSPNVMRAEVNGGAASLVVFSHNRADGWEAEVDGRSTPTVAVDGALMGVFVPPGRHSVELRYLPRSFVAGSAVSGLAFLAAVVAVFPRRREVRATDAGG